MTLAPSEPLGTTATRGMWRSSTRFMLLGGLLLALLAVIALAAPLIAPHDPEAVEVHRVLAAPDLLHPFGSDVLGRDVMSRVVYGVRASLIISVSAVVASLIFAVPLGALAGYFGRWVDSTISRTLDLIPDVGERVVAMRGIAEILEEKRGDLAGAFGWLGKAVKDLPLDDRSLVEVERLAASLPAWDELTRGGAEFSRARHAAADPLARGHAGRRPRGADPGAVGRDLSGPGHRRCRAGVHLSR